MGHSTRSDHRFGKHKKQAFTSVVNDFDTFTTTPGESVASASNHYRIVVNNMSAHVIVRTPLEYNLKFINSRGKGCGNMKSCLQSNGSLKKLMLYQLFDELQGHESNVAQTIRELSSDPSKPIIPYVQSSLPVLPTHNYPVDDSEAMDSKLRFQ